MVMLNDKTVKILNDYIDCYLDAPSDERMSCADRLVGALDMALATSEVKDDSENQ